MMSQRVLGSRFDRLRVRLDLREDRSGKDWET